MKLFLILTLLGTIGGGFVWYTKTVAGHAQELQRSVDERASLEAANQSYVEAIAWLEKDSAAKQKQLLRSIEQGKLLDAEVRELTLNLEGVSEEYKLCAAMPIPVTVYDSVFNILSETGSVKVPDTVSESLPSPDAVSSDPNSDVAIYE